MAISGIEILGLVLISSTILLAVAPMRFPELFPRTFPNFPCSFFYVISFINLFINLSYMTIISRLFFKTESNGRADDIIGEIHRTTLLFLHQHLANTISCILAKTSKAKELGENGITWHGVNLLAQGVQKIRLNFLAVANTLYLKAFTNLLHAKYYPSATCIAERTNGFPDILWEISTRLFDFEIFPFDVIETRYEFKFSHVTQKIAQKYSKYTIYANLPKEKRDNHIFVKETSN